jgi:orotidine-5'-phosphate decarboxylase
LKNNFLRNPIIAALDVDSAERCFALAEQLEGRVGAFKVGPRLCVRYGAELITQLARRTPVFVDNKYLDIPNTMESAIRATFEAGATLATVHAWAGPEALARLAKVEAELNQQRPFKILVVTVLTSFSQATLPPRLVSIPIADQVVELAKMAFDCGLTGVVCSPQEVAALRALSSQAFLVTPGVRLPENDAGDQKRVETPATALRRGASALVIGRPIVDAVDPLAATNRILSSIEESREKEKL